MLQTWDRSRNNGPTPPLGAAIRRHDLQKTYHVVSQPVVAVSLVGGLGIFQNH